MSALLADLLKVHREFTYATILPNSLGDGFLYANNSIFRNIRDAYLKAGYSFTSTDFCSLNSAPLLALPALLKNRMVPVRDNFLTLEKVIKLCGETIKMNEVPLVLNNQLLHECTHCVVESILPNEVADASDRVMRVLVAESIADATEAAGSLLINSEVYSHIYRMNVYYDFYPKKQVREDLLMARSEVGGKRIFKIIFFSYLLANFLQDSVEDSTLEFVFRELDLRPGQVLGKELLRKCLKVGFNLDRKFRENAASSYMRLLGFEPAIQDLVNFDPLDFFSQNQIYREFLEQFSNLIEPA